MSISARTSILRRLRTNRPSRAIQEKSEHTIETSQTSVAIEWVAKEPNDKPTSKAAVDRFKKLLTNNHAELFITNESGFENTLLDWLEEHCQTSSCIVSEHPALKALLPKALPHQIQNINLAELIESDNAKKTLFHDIATSVCFADSGITKLGALVLKASPTQPRTLSLVAPTNVLIVKAKDLVDDLGTALKLVFQAEGSTPSNCIIVSGPSKTADIQQTLAYGAHGPKRLVVFLLT